MKQEKGITLVALIITIIILIILAAVTIIAVKDSNLVGIATKGTEDYSAAQVEESQKIEELATYLEDAVSNIVSLGANGAGGSTGEGDGSGGGEGGDTVTLPEGWEGEKVYAAKSEDGITVPVPKGFTVSEVEGEKRVDTGLVIKTTQNGVTSEFVWVPVSNPSEMFGANGGKLYDFGTSASPKNPPTEREYSSTGYREPDYLKNTNSGDASKLIGSGIDQLKTVVGITGSNDNEILENWKTQLQNEYNQMKTSVEKYNGFYIGRYETGNLSGEKAAVVKNNSDIANQNWYAQYQKSKTIANGTGATSSMIWGCQWDATMKWFLSSSKEEIRTFVTNSTGKGNYAGTQGTTNKQIPTGSNDDYSVNNIYDMAGNVYDWTLEANNTNMRVSHRGGLSK